MKVTGIKLGERLEDLIAEETDSELVSVFNEFVAIKTERGEALKEMMDFLDEFKLSAEN